MEEAAKMTNWRSPRHRGIKACEQSCFVRPPLAYFNRILVLFSSIEVSWKQTEKQETLFSRCSCNLSVEHGVVRRSITKYYGTSLIYLSQLNQETVKSYLHIQSTLSRFLNRSFESVVITGNSV